MLNKRSKAIIHTLIICLSASTLAAIAKLIYGTQTGTLAFIADGIHSLFDSTATIFGIFSVFLAARPPDEGHPYGHQKFEVIAAMVIGVLLLLAAFEVGKMSVGQFLEPGKIPEFSKIGVLILLITMVVNIGIAKFEAKRARELHSPFLASDSAHNLSDFLVTCAVLVSLVSARYHIPYVDSVVSMLIAFYLVYLAVHLMKTNLDPLVDKSVLDPVEVERVAGSVQGVIHCHAIRSRGQGRHHFLDLSIHLPGHITLEEAHTITHKVERALRDQFPTLEDVVIHTEPHGHGPCMHE